MAQREPRASAALASLTTKDRHEPRDNLGPRAGGVLLSSRKERTGEFPPALMRAIGVVVARFLHTEEVTGSIPVSPTRMWLSW